MERFDVKQNNTERTFELAIARANELNTDIVLATTTGNTALEFLKAREKYGFKRRTIAVTHAYGSREKGTNIMPEEVRSKLKENDVIVVTAAHALSGVERSLSKKHQGVYPAEIIADTLRMISAGTKVCVEIGAMAMDAGAIEYQKPVVCIGGTGRNADTACVLTPSYSASLMETKINEFLCKPDFYKREEQ